MRKGVLVSVVVLSPGNLCPKDKHGIFLTTCNSAHVPMLIGQEHIEEATKNSLIGFRFTYGPGSEEDMNK